MNKVILTGRLTKDVDFKQPNDDYSFITANVVTSEKWKNKDTGEYEEKAEFHRVVLSGKNLSKFAEVLTKGCLVEVDGKLVHRSYVQDDIRKYVTEVQARKLDVLSWPKRDGEYNSDAIEDEDGLPF